MRKFALVVVVVGLVGCRQERVTAAPVDLAWGGAPPVRVSSPVAPTSRKTDVPSEEAARLLELEAEAAAQADAYAEAYVQQEDDWVTAREAASLVLGMTPDDAFAALGQRCLENTQEKYLLEAAGMSTRVRKLECRNSDGSRLELQFVDDSLEGATSYGQLPVVDRPADYFAR